MRPETFGNILSWVQHGLSQLIFGHRLSSQSWM